jgi:pyridoxal phosphate enzyme (YggS family)
MSNATVPPDIARAYERVLNRIAAACRRSGRDPGGVQLVAVTKTVAPERIREAVDAGLTTFGENRVQDARPKVLAVVGATWHLVGQLQSNKARRAVELFDAIETVDSVALAKRLDRLSGELRPRQGLPALLQVNVDRDPAKAGFDSVELDRALDELEGLENLRIDGLMTVGRQVANAEEARPTFRILHELSERLRATHADLGPGLSMGMTDDFEVAIEEGATIVRVGRAIFGERPHHHDGHEDHDH